MTKLYQIINFQFDSVRFFKSLEEAKDYITTLQKTYPDEAFYVIELEVAFYKGGS